MDLLQLVVLLMSLQKFPKNDGFSFGYDYGSINSVVDDKVLFGNSTVLA